MHLGYSEVLTPLKMFCENMLTHVHKVIHLVVGKFEQGLGTSPVLYTEKTEVTISDRTLVLVGPAHLVSGSSECAVSVS